MTLIPNLPKRTPKILLAALAGAVISGCGHPVQETAAHKIANLLPSVLGPAAHYDVQVDGDPFALARGRARAVHLQGVDVQVSKTITLDTLNADVSDVSFSRATRRLEHVGQAQFTATLGQEHLAFYLARAKPLLPSLTVRLRAEDVQAQVPVTFLGVQTITALTGTLKPNEADPQKLDFVTGGAKIGFVPLPAALVNLAVERLNPVVSLSGLRVPLTVTGVTVVNSRLTLQGTADLNGLVRAE